MKTVAELNEDFITKRQIASGVKVNETVAQLESIMDQVQAAHESAIEADVNEVSIRTKLNLTIQAQTELVESGYEVNELTYGRGEEDPYMYEVKWKYRG